MPLWVLATIQVSRKAQTPFSTQYPAPPLVSVASSCLGTVESECQSKKRDVRAPKNRRHACLSCLKECLNLYPIMLCAT